MSDALSSFEDASISDVRGLVDNATQLFNNISGLLEDNIGDFGKCASIAECSISCTAI